LSHVVAAVVEAEAEIADERSEEQAVEAGSEQSDSD